MNGDVLGPEFQELREFIDEQVLQGNISSWFINPGKQNVYLSLCYEAQAIPRLHEINKEFGVLLQVAWRRIAAEKSRDIMDVL